MKNKPRRKIERHLPPIGTTLTARFKKEKYEAKIVKAPKFPEGRAVRLNDTLYRTLSGAAKAVTKHSQNGWVFWKF